MNLFSYLESVKKLYYVNDRYIVSAKNMRMARNQFKLDHNGKIKLKKIKKMPVIHINK